MKPSYDMRIHRWQKCPVNDLAAKFHAYNPVKSQFGRVSEFYLTGAEINELFPAGREAHSFDIWFGLNEENPRDGEVRLIIRVFCDDTKVPTSEKEFQFVSPGSKSLAAEVPHEFKKWVSRNWLALDISFIDDVLSATMVPKSTPAKNDYSVPPPYLMERLRGYHFTESNNGAVLKFLNAKGPESVSMMIFHFGVDMNKHSKPGFFAFAPVLEFQMNSVTAAQLAIIQKEGLRYFITDGETPDPVYYEYMKPCPSTCDTNEQT